MMSISQGQQSVRGYARQFETLLGCLDSYDEGLMLNQFIWRLQPDLARSVSLHYPRTISKTVSLAETTELAIKALRRPNWKSSTVGNLNRVTSNQNRGRGSWQQRGRNYCGGRAGQIGGSSGQRKGASGYRGGRGKSSLGPINYDPLACYRCEVHGHLAHDCPQVAQS